MFTDFESAPISERLRAGLAVAQAVTRGEPASFSSVIERAFQAGLERDDIEDVVGTAFRFNQINRLADAFDFELPKPGRLQAVAKMLDRARLLRPRPRPAPFNVQDGGILRPVELDITRDQLLTRPGSTPPDLRRSVEAFTANLRGAGRIETAVPDHLISYLEKLALHAYKIVDEDIGALKARGYDDDAIFELTFAGAFGAALAPLELFVAELERTMPAATALAG